MTFFLFVLGILAMTAVVSAYPPYMYKENYNGRVFYTQADTGMMFGSYTYKTMYREYPQFITKNRAYFVDTERIRFAQTPDFSLRASKPNSRGAQEPEYIPDFSPRVLGNIDYPRYAMNRRSGKVYYIQRS